MIDGEVVDGEPIADRAGGGGGFDPVDMLAVGECRQHPLCKRAASTTACFGARAVPLRRLANGMTDPTGWLGL